jgi:hypothetical protein
MKTSMATWSKDELGKIAEADDLHISPFREDGRRTAPRRGFGPSWSKMPSTCANSRWYQAAVRQKAGRITAAGMTKDVTFEPVSGPIDDLVDNAYRTKYHDSPYLSPMIGARARSATVKVTPRGTEPNLLA